VGGQASNPCRNGQALVCHGAAFVHVDDGRLLGGCRVGGRQGQKIWFELRSGAVWSQRPPWGSSCCSRRGHRDGPPNQVIGARLLRTVSGTMIVLLEVSTRRRETGPISGDR